MDERIAVFGMALGEFIRERKEQAGVEAAMITLISSIDDPTDCFMAIIADVPRGEMAELHQQFFCTTAMTLTKMIGKANVLNLLSQAFAAEGDYEEVSDPFEQLNGRPM